MANFFETLTEVLKTDERFFTEDGTLLRNKVYETAMNMDEGLIGLLLGNTETKMRFFTEVGRVLVFDKVGFGWVINNRQFLPDSYTRFKNRIGLTDPHGDLISASNDVVLSFPYKDCVLEGGQTKDDQSRDEIFFNEILAPREVDRLLYPKVLVNARRHTSNGIEEDVIFSDEDNLIIKGNNLLAISSLLKRYEGRVKCIYIDPPYYFSVKKDEDTFAYNSNFKLSTWLVFMKNRLEIARRLLSNDGAIFVQISDDGVAELHRLLKDVFCQNGENNFINKITVKTKSPSGFASVNPGVFETAEYILAFAKNKRRWTYNQQFVKSEYDANYKWFIVNREDEPSSWKIVNLFEQVASEQGFSTKKQAIDKLGDVAFYDIVGRFALNHSDSVFRYTAIGNDAGQTVVETRDMSKIYRDKIFVVTRETHYNIYVLNGQEIAFYAKKIREIDGERVPSIQLSNIWMDTPYEGIAKEGNVTLKGGKKPEKLIRRIIEMSTNAGDLVLDFHLGSGTTCAVAHKLGRKYIGVEQLDYGENDSLVRLANVIAGDASGISKAVDWQGGGSFVCCELAMLNQCFVEEVKSAKTDSEVTSVLEGVMKSGFISSKVNPTEIAGAASDFEALSLEDKKRFVLELLDKNMLYVNLSDLDDEEYAISEEDKAFTRSFYGLEVK